MTGMSEKPLVSVIVPTRNSARSLGRCLQSIARQRYPAIEIIVVDNNSADLTREIACAATPHVLTCGPERCAQRNSGARAARGSFLFFVDSDMTLDSEVVEQCVQLAVSDPGVAGIIIPERSVGVGFWAHSKALERSCYIGDDSIEAARFFPRAVFEAVTGYDEGLTAAEDWDLSQRVRERGTLRRVGAFIAHDEGHLTLRNTMRSKFYYGRTLEPYIRKQPRRAAQQFQFLRPAYVRHWRRLAAHPLLTLGMVVMKGCEFAAGGAGLALAAWQGRRTS
jgi:arabinofuranan 3-O-arabinosyltransferase